MISQVPSRGILATTPQKTYRLLVVLWLGRTATMGKFRGAWTLRRRGTLWLFWPRKDTAQVSHVVTEEVHKEHRASPIAKVFLDQETADRLCVCRSVHTAPLLLGPCGIRSCDGFVGR